MSDLTLENAPTDAIEQDEELTVPQQEAEQSGGFFTPGTIFLIVSIIVFAAIIGFALQNQRQTQPTSGKAPDFTLTTFSGEQFKLSDFRGKVVVLNFWASWCGPCEAEALDLQSAWELYEPTGEVVFIGVAYADNGPKSMAFLDKYGVTYYNGPDQGTVISEDYNIEGVPETFIIDKNGDISSYYFAPLRRDQVINMVDEALAGGGAS